MKLRNLFAPGNSSPENEEELCCGKHAVCKKIQPVRTVSDPVEYYDDEELDVFKNRPSSSYSEDEIAQFAEIFHTLWKSDIPGWLVSLHRRNIELPNSLKTSLSINH
jgi:hypothetical protein